MGRSPTLVGAQLLLVPQIKVGTPHRLDELHLFEGDAEYAGGGACGFHCGFTGLFGCGARVFSSIPRFLGQSSELFSVAPGRFGCAAAFFGRAARLLGILTRSFRLLAHSLCVKAVLLFRPVVTWHIHQRTRSRNRGLSRIAQPLSHALLFELCDPPLCLLPQRRRIAGDALLAFAFEVWDTPIEGRDELPQMTDQLLSVRFGGILFVCRHLHRLFAWTV